MPSRGGVAFSNAVIAIVLIVIIIAGIILWITKPWSVEPVTTTTSTTRPEYSQLTIGVVSSKIVLDPAVADDYVSWEILSKVMEGLVKIDPKTGAIKPGIAERWSTPDNGLTWIFILRKGVKFADGTELKAEDVVRSIQRVMIIRGSYSWLVTEFVYNIQALNDTAVMIKLKKSVQDFPVIASLPVYYIVHPNYPLQNPVPGATYGGVGPYKIDSVTTNQIILSVNPNYYGEQPGTKKLVFKLYPSSSDLRSALENGEIDIAWWGLTQEDAAKLKSEGYNVITSDKTAVKILALKVSGTRPTHLPEVRKAIAYAVDPQAVSNALPGDYDEPVLSVIPSNYIGYTEAYKNYTGKMIDKSKELLRKAGYGEFNLLRLTLIISSSTYGSSDLAIANEIKKDIEETGVAFVEIKDLPHDAFLGAILTGDYDMALITLYPIYPDPAFYIMLSVYSKANKYLGIGYVNPQADTQIELALSTVDYSLRARIYETIQTTYLSHDVPLVPLVEFPTFAAMKSDITGVEILPNMFLSTP
ncbi:MAG: ABC transporter substrate-binding protein [Desulfurococcales archaeon]|nr:ABC transporter substrate-binding protein [Desulfurococcales archaeon]